MALQISEILQKFNEAGTREEKKNVLLKNRDMKALQHTIRGAMHPRIKFLFDSIPAYKSVDQIPVGMGYVTVASELKKLYLFEEGNPNCPKITPPKRANLLRGILEGMDRLESKVFEGIILKKLPVSGMTSEMVEEVWPGILTNQGW